MFLTGPKFLYLSMATMMKSMVGTSISSSVASQCRFLSTALFHSTVANFLPRPMLTAVAAAAALLGAEVGKYHLVTLVARSPSTHVPVNGLFLPAAKPTGHRTVGVVVVVVVVVVVGGGTTLRSGP